MNFLCLLLSILRKSNTINTKLVKHFVMCIKDTFYILFLGGNEWVLQKIVLLFLMMILK